MQSLPCLSSALLISLLLVSGCQSDKDYELITSSTDAGDKYPLGKKESPGTVSGETDIPAAAPSDEALLAQTETAVAKAVGFETYVPPKPGTVFTFHNNWNSLPPVIVYKVDGVVKKGDVDYLKMTAISGMKENVEVYYETANFSMKGYRDSNDKAMLTYKPMDQRYRFPMKPGDHWVSAWQSYDHREEKKFKGGGVVSVVSREMLKLPAGEFETMKVKLPTARDLPSGMSHYIWFSPKLGVTVKEQIGNGTMNWTQILAKVEYPTAEM